MAQKQAYVITITLPDTGADIAQKLGAITREAALAGAQVMTHHGVIDVIEYKATL